jgi:hypothetical protein
MRVLAAIALLAIASGTARAEKAEPFGVKGGAAVTDYGGFVSLFGQKIVPPSPHPIFTRYIAHSTEQTGICLVRGETENIGAASTGPTGETVREIFAKIQSQLESRYGPGDFSESFSVFAYDKEWLKLIERGDKHYQAAWRFEHEDSDLSLTEIILYLQGPPEGAFRDPYRNTVYLKVQYTFSNYDECKRLKDAGVQADEDAQASKL